MFSYKEQDSNDKMTMEAVLARGNNIYDLVFVDNVGPISNACIKSHAKFRSFWSGVYNFICFFYACLFYIFVTELRLYYSFSPTTSKYKPISNPSLPHPSLPFYYQLFFRMTNGSC